MTLSDLLVALAGNQKLSITLAENDGTALITFNAAGYASVESDLGARTVKKITVDSPSAVTVTLEPATP